MKCTDKEWDTCQVEKWDAMAVITIKKIMKEYSIYF